MRFRTEVSGIAELERDLADVVHGRGLHARAKLHAGNRVAAMARTRTVRAVRTEHGISAKSVRSRIRVYRATLARPRVRLWAGLRAKVKLREKGTLNKGVRKAAPHNAFEQTMRSGHRGLYYRAHRNGTPRTRRIPPRGGNDLPIHEVALDLTKSVNENMPRIARGVWMTRYDELYGRDLDRRLRRKGWR